MLVCSICKVPQDTGMFYRNAARKTGYSSWCKACSKGYQRAWHKNRRANPSIRVFASGRVRKTNEDWAATYRTHANKRYERYSAKLKEAARTYKKDNRGKVTAWNTARKEQQRVATPIWANMFFIEEAYSLAVLRERITGGKWEVDHIVPLRSDKVCGLHSHTNIQVITKTSNMKKSNRVWPYMWAPV